MVKKQKPETDLKLEVIQIPFPEEAKEDAEKKATEISELAEETIGEIDTKSIDLYEGLPIPIMVAEWGMDKTMEYLDASANLYEIMGMDEYATKVKTAKENYYAEYAEIASAFMGGPVQIQSEEDLKKAKKQVKAKTAKEKAVKAGKTVKKAADTAIAKADKLAGKLSTFTNARRADIQATVQLINSIPDKEQLEDFIVNYFLDKAEKKTGEKIKSSQLAAKVSGNLLKKIQEKFALIEPILAWANELFSLYQAGSSVSLDSVVGVVTSLVTIQFQPYIDKYHQYQSIVAELQAFIAETTLILDAVNNKASEFGSPIKIPVPPLPTIPNLPDLPV